MDVLPQRIECIRDGLPGRGPVAYWMSRDQRTADNWALLFAQETALAHALPLVVVFCLSDSFPGRH